jgi:hypothetical protein
MSDGEDGNLFPPDHVGDVVFTKARCEIGSPGVATAAVVEQRIIENQAQMPVEGRIECGRKRLILLRFIQGCVVPDDRVKLVAGGWMNFEVASHASRLRPSSANKTSVRR